MNNRKFWIVLLILLAILTIRFFLFYRSQPTYHDGQHITLETTLLSEPKIKGRFQTIFLNLDNGNRVFITIPKYPQYHYADILRFSGVLKVKTASTPGDKKRGLIINEKIVLTMSFPKVEAVKNKQNFPLAPIKSGLAITSFVRQKMILFFEKSLDPTSSSLLLGIVFGIKEKMPSEFMENLREAGVMHVIAASGMNVSMFGAFISSLFGFFLKRKIALALTVFAIVFYAFLAGLEASIVRASIMGILVFSSQIMGRQKLSFYILFFTAFLMLFVSPVLIFDIGFQLSFMATFGLLYLKPLIGNIKSADFITRKVIAGDDVLTTTVAQVSTLPIILSNFGTYSLLSIIVNGLLLWTIPFLMILGGLGAIFGLIIEPTGRLFLYLALPFLLFFEGVVNIFAGFGGKVGIDNISLELIIGYYLLLLSIIIFLDQKKVSKS